MFLHAILPVLVIFITIITLSTLFYGIYYILENKKQIDANWPQYKCRPYVFPFAGILIGPNTTNPVNNFRDCSWLIFKSFFDVLISPFVQILTVIVSILTNFTNDIQNIRKMVAYMRNSIRSIALDTYSKIKDAYYRIAYVYKSFMKVFLNIFKTMQSSFNVLVYSFYSLSSIWNGPIGGAARFFCFDEETPIRMFDGSYKPISHIHLDDMTAGGRVTACYKFLANSRTMYIINGVAVSGSHMVLEDDKWIRVQDSKYAIGPINYQKKYIYSLQTTTSIIYTQSNIFRDYDEINDKTINFNIYLNQLYNLNNTNHTQMNPFIPIYNPKPIKETFKTLFDPYTKITLTNGTTKPICNVEVGDITSVSGKVLGIVKARRNDIPMYNYKDRVVCSHGTIIYTDTDTGTSTGVWSPVNVLTTAIKGIKEEVLYSLITESGTIFINNITFRDHDVNHVFEPVVNKYIVHTVNTY